MTRPRPFPFDAVLFDLDGTLVATDRFWVAAAKAAAHRTAAELGLALEIPSASAWMSLVGYPLEAGLRRLFPGLGPSELAHLLRACVREEETQLRSGGAIFMPGGREALVELGRRGVRLGIASNCARSYLDHMRDALGLGALVHEMRCLDSPGVGSKADMLQQLLEAFGTRSAVLVGDRRGDTEAAREAGIPAIHFAGAFAEPGDAEHAQASIGHLDQLLPLLERRSAWIRAALQAVGAFATPAPRTIGITGPTAAGKTLFARDAARVLEAEGISVRILSVDEFARPPGPRPSVPEADHLAAAGSSGRGVGERG